MTQHQGGCHCGAVRFQADLSLDELTTCNCSLCGKTGSIMAFVPASQVTMLSGEDAQTDYQFAKKSIHHTFCTRCGVRSVAFGKGPDGSEWASVNVRCLDGIDVHDLKITQTYDGKAL